MKRKLLLTVLLVAMLSCILAIGIGAAEASVGGAVYTLDSTTEPPSALVSNLVAGETVVTIPSTITVDGVEYRVTGFKTQASGNIQVSTITNVTSVQELYITSDYITEIVKYAFDGSTALKKLRITSPVQVFGHECFKKCTSIEDVYVNFDQATSIENAAFFFTANDSTTSKAIWNYNGEPINFYNVTWIGPRAFMSSRIGGYNVTGGQENTIIWPKKLDGMGTFAFTNGYVGGTVYLNAVTYGGGGISNDQKNKQFSACNYFDTLILGPDTTICYNWNNGGDGSIKTTIETVIILSKDVAQGKNGSTPRTNLFDNWGEFNLYYFDDCLTGTTIANQTTIGQATKIVIDDYTLTHDAACKLNITVSVGGEQLENITETNHVSYDRVGAVDETKCPLGAVSNFVCACDEKLVLVKYNDGYTSATEHNVISGLNYVDALTPVISGEYCTQCTLKGEITEYGALITPLGFSAQIGGDMICVGFQINKATADVVPNISLGVVITVPDEGTDMATFEPVNNNLEITTEKGAAIAVEEGYEVYELIVKSFSKDEAYYETPLVMCAYVADGEKVDYLTYLEGGFTQTEYASTITFKQISEDCAEKYALTYSCNSTMGTLSGETEQVVYEGESAKVVTATANEGYTFVCWSDGSTEPSIEVTPSKDMSLVAHFTPASTGLPVMTINTENGVDITTKEYYINCEITLLDTETGNSIGGKLAEIKGRGNSTWTKFDKKPYKFKFDKKQDLFGYGKEKTWVLLADARDYSLLRNMLALNAGLALSELEYNSMGQSVELYVNGEYRGVYYLCEQIQVKENRVNITQEDEELVQGPEDLGYLIEMDAWAADSSNQSGIANYTADGDVYVTVPDNLNSNRAYVIKDPEDILFDENGNLKAEFLNYVQGFLADGIAAVQGSDYAAVCELVDVKSFAQAYIIYELFKNPDVNYSSVYFYKDVDGKLVCAPLWDFDMAIGNVTHKSGAGTNAQNFRDTTFLWAATQNPWFKGLLQFDEFKALVGQELADNEAALKSSIASDLAYARKHADAYKKNFEVWDLIGNTEATEKMGAWSVPGEFKEFITWEEHLVYIESYLEESLAHLIATYPAPTAE